MTESTETLPFDDWEQFNAFVWWQKSE